MHSAKQAAVTAVAALILASCSGGLPGTGGGGAGGGGAGGAGNGGNTGAAGPGGSGGGGSAASGSITGTFTVQAQKHSEDPTIEGVIDDTLHATVTVRMTRDSSAAGEAYVDNGSSYKVSAETKTSRLLGTCTATSDTIGEGDYDFLQQPYSTPNQITATIDRASKTALFFVSFSWGTHVTANDCDGRAPFSGENAVTAACPFFGLTAKLTEGSGTDQIDTACQLPGGETYAGVLTLTH